MTIWMLEVSLAHIISTLTIVLLVSAASMILLAILAYLLGGGEK